MGFIGIIKREHKMRKLQKVSIEITKADGETETFSDRLSAGSKYSEMDLAKLSYCLRTGNTVDGWSALLYLDGVAQFKTGGAA